MYAKDGWCKSQCSECGTACEAPRLTDIASVERFAKLECEVVLGSLDLSSMHHVPESVVIRGLGSVTKIQGDLIIRDSPDMISLGFLHRLRQVNRIIVENCADLVDARLPSLVSHDSITITHCPRLCDARKPSTSTNISSAGCAAVQLEQYFELQETTSGAIMADIAAKLMQTLRSVADSTLEVSKPLERRVLHT